MLEAFDEVDWIEKTGCYRAKITLDDGADDAAIVCAISGGPAMGLLEALPRYVGQFQAFLGADTPEGMAGAMTTALQDGQLAGELWGHVDAIVASSLITWTVPGLETLPWLTPDLSKHPPNAIMGAAEREAILKSLPLPVIVRLVIGALWLIKN